jgi:20S proteasome subunit alpha 2
MGDMNFSLTTFNKTGKLMQIEYALNRVNQGKMALGIKGNWAASLSLRLL